MKTIVYTYKNYKPLLVSLDRFYKVKNKKALKLLISNLLDLDIDAVISPADLTFPCTLELESGFGLTLKRVNINDLRQDRKTLKKIIKSVERK